MWILLRTSYHLWRKRPISNQRSREMNRLEAGGGGV